MSSSLLGSFSYLQYQYTISRNLLRKFAQWFTENMTNFEVTFCSASEVGRNIYLSTEEENVASSHKKCTNQAKNTR